MRIAAFALLLLLAACGTAPVPETAAGPGDLVRVNEDEVKSLDPQAVSDLTSLRVATDLYEGLTRIGADGQVEPGLAERWAITPDGRIWTFVLRPGLRFSDGIPITAGAFAASFARLRAETSAAPVASLFDSIRSVSAADPRTIRVTLALPFPALLELLAHPAAAVLPMHRIAADPDGWTKAHVGSGPYRLARWDLHSRMQLAANPLHWDAANVQSARVTYLPVDDDQTALRLFRSGEAHTVGDFPASQLGLLRQRVGTAVHIAPYRGSYYWVFNTRRPPFSDVRVRRALSMAVERDLITGRLLGVGNPPALSVVPPGLAGYPGVQPDWAGWPRTKRLATARALLAAAGYGPDRPLVVEARFNSDVDHRRIGIALASFWKPLGVDLKLLNTEATLHFAALRAGDFMIARSGWIGDLSAAENFLAIHRSDAGPINYSGYASPTFDAALDAGLAEADPSKRNLQLAKAETILLAESPVLPLYFYVSKNLVSPRLSGWRDNAANTHPSRTLAVVR